MMSPLVGYGNFLKLPLLKCHQWTLTFISTVDVGNVIHSGAILARQRDTDINDRLTLAFEIPMVSPITFKKLPVA